MLIRMLCLSFLSTFVLCQNDVSAQERQFYEVRFHSMTSEAAADRFDSNFQEHILPIIRDQGITQAGVFKVLESKVLDRDDRVSIIAFDTLDAFVQLREKLGSDPAFFKQSSAYFDSQVKGKPDCTQVSTMLLHAMTGMPKLEIPSGQVDGKRRFELRTYQSENERQAMQKIQMFNDAEMQIFRETGLRAVFFGGAFAGADLPQLTYMLVHDDLASQKESWKAFVSSEDWKQLNADPKYQGIKLKITAHMLEATDYSTIR